MIDDRGGWGEFFSILATLFFLCLSVYLAYLASSATYDVMRWRVNDFAIGLVTFLFGAFAFLLSFASMVHGSEYLVNRFKKNRS